MNFVYALGGVNLLVGLYSLWGSARLLATGRRPSPRLRPGFAEAAGVRLPSVTLHVPCCGEEFGLEENLEALAGQDYPDLNVVFVVEDAADPALPVIDRVISRAACRASRVIAGPARGRGQKVQNLLAALAAGPRAEVLAFADSDGRPDRDWLRLLVGGLEFSPQSEPAVGAATGYRFYLPERSFASMLRSVWNAGVLTLLGDHDRNFAWGGSMAISRDVFDEAEVAKAWEGALSDDYALTHAVRRAGYRIRFVPSCLVPSPGSIRFRELFSWCARQMAVTRVYWPTLWRVGGATQILYCSFVALAAVAVVLGDRTSGLLLGAVLASSFASGAIRALSVGDLAPRLKEPIRRRLWAFALLSPVASALTVYAFLRSALSRRIEWRGKRYEMRSPTETVVLSDPTRS